MCKNALYGMSGRPFLCVVWAPVEKWLGENCKQMERLCLHSRQFNVCRIVVVNYLVWVCLQTKRPSFASRKTAFGIAVDGLLGCQRRLFASLSKCLCNGGFMLLYYSRRQPTYRFCVYLLPEYMMRLGKVMSKTSFFSFHCARLCVYLFHEYRMRLGNGMSKTSFFSFHCARLSLYLQIISRQAWA